VQGDYNLLVAAAAAVGQQICTHRRESSPEKFNTSNRTKSTMHAQRATETATRWRHDTGAASPHTKFRRISARTVAGNFYGCIFFTSHRLGE
jgi:hypothetical protein